MTIPNHLINSTSPYLLQHAYNPVEWFPWGEEALKKAVDEDKLILVSIGYSACHWCHVMEHESFEDVEVAEIMNRFFVCIKVDREERPDIDQVYMAAVQLMTGRGGWPLNCFTLPDGRPVYGGTYFQKQQWMNILLNLADLYKKDKPKLLDYAEQLTDGVRKLELITPSIGDDNFSIEILSDTISNWKQNFDDIEGGPNRAPKFPLPNNYIFLLQQAFLDNDKELFEHVNLTLKKMAYGGIYDQIGGGFARYSVDGMWKVPHFEKMLYDNAQLVSLYSLAFRYFNDPLYKHVVYQTLDFVERELTGDKGNYFSALDADSEGVEGKFYVWKKEELEKHLGNYFTLFADYFNVNDRGFWEHDNYILLRHDNDDVIADRFGLEVDALRTKVTGLTEILLKERAKRVRPGLDDKTLTSWNGLMITGYLDAYDSFGEIKFLNSAKRNAEFLLKAMSKSDGGLNHNYKNGISNINGYLEDYAFLVEALIRLYQATFEVSWFEKAEELMTYTIEHFYDEKSGMFFFTSDIDPPLIARKMELQDNVIPSSNSQTAKNLFALGHYFENSSWVDMSRRMTQQMKQQYTSYGSAFSNWLMLYQQFFQPLNELVICGSDALNFRSTILKTWLPSGTLIGGCVGEENISMTKGRLKPNETLIYVCKNHTCQLPVSSPDDVRF